MGDDNKEVPEGGYEVTLTSVDKLTREEIATCIDVVVEGEAVPRWAAQTGVPQAARLGLVRCNGDIVGVGVIKGPNAQHARTVAEQHNHGFPETTPELGYASVRKAHRNNHLSSRIFEKLLSEPDEPLYAVTSDHKMKHLLDKHGFVERGVTTNRRKDAAEMHGGRINRIGITAGRCVESWRRGEHRRRQTDRD